MKLITISISSALIICLSFIAGVAKASPPSFIDSVHTGNVNHLGDRFYSASLGRFLTTDRAKHGYSEYTYTNGSVIRNSDPSGFGVIETIAKTVEASADVGDTELAAADLSTHEDVHEITNLDNRNRKKVKRGSTFTDNVILPKIRVNVRHADDWYEQLMERDLDSDEVSETFSMLEDWLDELELRQMPTPDDPAEPLNHEVNPSINLDNNSSVHTIEYDENLGALGFDEMEMIELMDEKNADNEREPLLRERRISQRARNRRTRRNKKIAAGVAIGAGIAIGGGVAIYEAIRSHSDNNTPTPPCVPPFC